MLTGSHQKILLIDDSETKTQLLRQDLESAGYVVETADNGALGWQKLIENRNNVSVIMLDRVMPIMDGMQFMEKLKSDSTVSDIPVVMQTSLNKSHQIAEGIRSGVYYYLVSPYDKDVMLSIVNSAINDHNSRTSIKTLMGEIQDVVGLLRDCNFELKTVEEAKKLTATLAHFFPDPAKVSLGISELLINSIEHGNLGITYDEKTRLLDEDRWAEEVQKRLKHPRFSSRKVHVSIISTENDISLWIRDQGNGFQWQDYLEISPERATHNHGRGIAMSNMISFDMMQYIGKGNEVVCKVFNRSA